MLFDVLALLGVMSSGPPDRGREARSAEEVSIRRVPLQPADASVGGVRQRPLSTGSTLLQRARAALLHPAQGTGLLQWQVATVLSEVTGARTRRATRPSARVHRSAPLSTCAQWAPGTGREIATGELRRVEGRGLVWPMQRTALPLARSVLALRGGGPRVVEPEPAHVLRPL